MSKGRVKGPERGKDKRKKLSKEQKNAGYASENELRKEPLDRPPEYDALIESDGPETVEMPDTNPDEIKLDRMEENYDPFRVENSFEFNANTNTAHLSQRKNCLFLKRVNGGVKVFSTLRLRLNVAGYERRYLEGDYKDDDERNKLFNRYARVLFVDDIKHELQNYLNGFYAFECESFNYSVLERIFKTDELAELVRSRIPGINKEKKFVDTVKDWMNNLSIQTEDGMLISFNYMTPKGSDNKSFRSYVDFRKVLGDYKAEFHKLVLKYREMSYAEFCDRTAFEDFVKEEMSFLGLELLAKSPEFKGLVLSLRERDDALV